MNPLVYGAYKFEFEVVCDITDGVSIWESDRF